MSETAIAIAILFVLFFGLILFRMPITYVMVISSVVTSLYVGIPLMTIFQRMAQGIQSFSFLAIPFFILAGEIMGSGGISQRLVKVADVFVGPFTGGLAQVNVLASTFFGGVSGSSTADVASIGAMLIPMMEEQGYDRPFSVDVTVCTATQAMIIPPSHNMVIYCMAAGGASTGMMFLGGVVPGLLLSATFMIVVYFMSKKYNYPAGRRYSLKDSVKIVKDGLLGIFTIVIILLGVCTGVFTATESAAIACAYAFVVTFFIYREIPVREMWPILGRSLRTLAMILGVISAANGFCYVMSYLRVPAIVTNFLLTITENKILLLILLNIILLIMGCLMDVAPLIVIVTPIMLPVAQKLGMDPIHFGIMMLMNLAVGLCTPPVGSTLFAGCSVGKISIEKCMTRIWPFYIAMVIDLLLVTFIPALSLWLPHLIMG